MMPEDRVALVTGAARGISAATVTRLCDQGYRVVALDSCGIGGERAGVTYPLARELDLRAIAQARRDRLIRVKARCRADFLVKEVSQDMRAEEEETPAP